MNQKINEFINNPDWMQTLSDEERYKYYLIAKKSLPDLKKRGNSQQLEDAINDYEKRHNILKG